MDVKKSRWIVAHEEWTWPPPKSHLQLWLSCFRKASPQHYSTTTMSQSGYGMFRDDVQCQLSTTCRLFLLGKDFGLEHHLPDSRFPYNLSYESLQLHSYEPLVWNQNRVIIIFFWMLMSWQVWSLFMTEELSKSL